MGFSASPTFVQHMWDSLIVGVCIVNHEGTVLEMNAAASRLMGWGAVCPASVSILDVFEGIEPPKGAGEVLSPLLYIVHERKVGWFPRVGLRDRQGVRSWVELKGVVVEEGDEKRYLLMFRDLSTETRLAEEYSRLASIPQESPFPIIEVDASGHLLYANPVMERLMEEAQIGQDGFTTALPEQFPDLAARCLSQGYLETNVEVQVGNKYFSWTFSPHPELGRLRGYGMDVSESKRAAFELGAFADMLEIKNRELDHALVKAEDATRAKAAFLATMSHEIRTPLNGVIGMAELLLSSSLDLEQQECTNIIRKSAEGLLAIINDILDFSKIESGRMPVETIGFNPTTLIEEVLDLFSERAYQKGLDLAGYVAQDIPDHLMGDPHRLRQILCNFVSNAIKFTSHGSVVIEVSKSPEAPHAVSSRVEEDLTLREKTPTDAVMNVRFCVTDTGIGISPSVQESIFDVFTQADSSMSRKFGGSGLGLAICKQLAELMYGTVGVASDPGEGSKFWCDLTFSILDNSLPPLADGRASKTGDILICSSRNGSVEVVSRYLQGRGINVLRVSTLDEIMAALEKSRVPLSTIVGLIVGPDIPQDEITLWHGTFSGSLASNIPIWGMTPFWLRGERTIGQDLFKDMIAMPVHRGQLYQCVFDEETVIDKSGTAVSSSQNGDRQRRQNVTVGARGSQLDTAVGQREGSVKQGPAVLIVEDNPVNQKVAAGLLEKLGCHILVAESGMEALKFFQDQVFDLIMMDWELPGMDGFETTRAIRDMERSASPTSRRDLGRSLSGAPVRSSAPVPIIGMTAHGLSEKNQQRWKNVMDDCLAKPIHLSDLAYVLERWIGFSVAGNEDVGQTSISSSTQSNDELPVDSLALRSPEDSDQSDADLYDFKQALVALDGDEGLFCSLLRIFVDTTPGLIQDLKTAVANDDREHLQHWAHQLKGALRALKAHGPATMAEQLEHDALTGILPDLHQQSERIADQVECLRRLFTDALQSWDAHPIPVEPYGERGSG